MKGQVVVLAAGRSTRLDGKCKLIVHAAGKPIHQWHTDAWINSNVDAVVRSEHKQEILNDNWAGSALVGFNGNGGPVGALQAYLEAPEALLDASEGIVVAYADSLIKSPIYEGGSWVGIAYAPGGRVWDYPQGSSWERGVPRVDVCMGIYRFHSVAALESVLRNVPMPTAINPEVAMIEVIKSYEKEYTMRKLRIDGWQDAGDWGSIARVR
jgi:hypothetical protein